MSKRRLGRGLDSLISSTRTSEEDGQDQEAPGRTPSEAPEASAPHAPQAAEGPSAAPAAQPAELPADRILPNPYQPRKDFDESGLQELTRSIAANGIIQPVVVRPRSDGRYELVTGERRLRAAQALDLASVPAIVREVPDERMLEMALVENIQREDLNPIEKAEAFRDFLGRYGLTQEQAAERVGLDRATLANHLRLLDLAGEVQTLVRRGALGMSHARTLAGLDDAGSQLDAAKKVVRQGLSVRQIERMVRRMTSGVRSKPARRRSISPEAEALEQELRSLLGTKVRIEETDGRGSGRIVVEYYSYDDFDRILNVIRR